MEIGWFWFYAPYRRLGFQNTLTSKGGNFFMKKEKSITVRLGIIIIGFLMMCLVIIFFSMYRTNYSEVKKAAGVEAFGCANITTALIDPDAIQAIKQGDMERAKQLGEEINWTIQHKGIFEGQYVMDLEGNLLAVDENLMEQGFDVGDKFHMNEDDLERLKITKAPVYSDVYDFGGMKRLTGYAPVFKDHDPDKEIIAISAIDFESSILHTRTLQMIKGGMLFSVIPLLLVGIVTIFLINRTVKPLQSVSNFASRIAKGDLTVEPLTIKTNDEIGRLSNDLNTMAENLKSIISEVASNASELAGTTEEILASSEEMATTAEKNVSTYQVVQKGAEEQLTIVNDTTNVLQKIAEETDKMNERATLLQDESQKTMEHAEQGDSLIKSSLNEMEQMNKESADLKVSMNELQEKSEEISQIITIITQIAEQTNLLALNASIEAANAGEHGKGFAVVANEVRRLAEQSRASTDQISELINEIQEQAMEAVQQTDTSIISMKNSSSEMERAGKSFYTIKDGINAVVTDIRNISSNMNQISKEIDIMVTSMENIKSISTENVDGSLHVMELSEEQNISVEEMKNAMSLLTDMAEKLNDRTNQFTL